MKSAPPDAAIDDDQPEVHRTGIPINKTPLFSESACAGHKNAISFKAAAVLQRWQFALRQGIPPTSVRPCSLNGSPDKRLICRIPSAPVVRGGIDGFQQRFAEVVNREIMIRESQTGHVSKSGSRKGLAALDC
jgi:hypothetical protein